MKKTIKIFILLSIFFAGFYESAYSFDWLQAAKGVVKGYQAYSITDSQVEEYVKQYVQLYDQQNSVAPESNAYTIRLRKLTSGLKNVDGKPLNFKVYLTSEVNAFACADGSVRVYSGLLDLMNDDEVLGVIGHEIGHVAHKHTKKAFKAALINSAIRETLASSNGWVGKLSASQIGSIGEALMNQSYSKKQETDADNYGYDFLKSSGKNPWAMAMAFKKLQSLESNSSGITAKIGQMFSDHPSTDARIKNMENRAKKDGIAPPAEYK